MNERPRNGAEIGVIGGSGLYALLDGATEHRGVHALRCRRRIRITVAEVGGRRVAFLPRHGRDHRFPPHQIPYRANLWALRSLGVRQIIAPCAVGGLRPELGPGTFVVPDQLIDRTSGRAQTFYDTGAVHVSFADPYCPAGRAAVLAAPGERVTAGRRRHDGRRRGPALLDPGRVALVHRDRRHDRQHDRPPGGGPGPRAGPLLHGDRAGDRPGRGRRGRPRCHPGGGLRGLRRQHGRCCARSCSTR